MLKDQDPGPQRPQSTVCTCLPCVLFSLIKCLPYIFFSILCVCLCVCMRVVCISECVPALVYVCTGRQKVDVESCLLGLFPFLNETASLSQIKDSVTWLVSLARLFFGFHLCLHRQELQAACHTHSAFVWVIGI